MRTTAVSEPLALLALLASSASAANVVEIGIQPIRNHIPHLNNRLRSRATTAAGTYVETLLNNVTGGGYYASVSVGTPPQPQVLVVDTGSSDIWVVADDADLCTSVQLQRKYRDSCDDTYDSSASSTFKLISEGGFDISYLDGSGSSGDYISDTFSVGGATLKNLQIGLATETQRGVGIMGISYSASESTLDTYPNLLDQFLAQGLIATKAFSLYLNDFRSDAGSILFGGVDTEKFIGTLKPLPVLRSTRNGETGYQILAVALNSVTVQLGEDDAATPVDIPNDRVAAILDSGTTLSYLPTAMANSLFDAVGAYTDSVETGYTFIDCNNASDLTITFQFGDATIVLPSSQVVLDLFADFQDEIPFNVPFDRACLFGFQDLGSSSSTLTSGSYALLGDTFLRSAYAVYDLTNNEIALAQSNLNSTASNVVELQAADSGIPTTLTGVKSQEATSAATTTHNGSSTATQTSNLGDNDVVTVTAAPLSSSNAAPPSHQPGFSVLTAAAAACLFSFLGGVLVLA